MMELGVRDLLQILSDTHRHHTMHARIFLVVLILEQQRELAREQNSYRNSINSDYTVQIQLRAPKGILQSTAKRSHVTQILLNYSPALCAWDSPNPTLPARTNIVAA
jgi:hypothetical protein